jgi:very-short-patch-repair endonuclease
MTPLIYNHKEFGKLTILFDSVFDEPMFIASEVALIWKHSNIKQTVKRVLLPEDFILLKRGDFDDILNEYINRGVFKKKTPKVLLLNPMGVVKMVMNTTTIFDRISFLSWISDLGFIQKDLFFIRERKEIQFGKAITPFLNSYNYDVTPQKQIGSYRVDFFVRDISLCIEFDEKQHEWRKEEDDKKTAFLKKSGYTVLRIKETENVGSAMAKISSLIPMKRFKEMSKLGIRVVE